MNLLNKQILQTITVFKVRTISLMKIKAAFAVEPEHKIAVGQRPRQLNNVEDVKLEFTCILKVKVNPYFSASKAFSLFEYPEKGDMSNQ